MNKADRLPTGPACLLGTLVPWAQRQKCSRSPRGPKLPSGDPAPCRQPWKTKYFSFRGPDLQYLAPVPKVVGTSVQSGTQHPVLNFGPLVASVINCYF